MIIADQFSLKGLLIWFTCALFFLYEFLLRTVVGTFQHPIMYDLELSTVEFSVLSSTSYLLIYSLMQIPVGLIVDRHGLKKSLLVGSVVCTISSIGFAFSHSLILAIFFRILMGFGSAFGFICLLVSVYDWLPQKHRALMLGMSQFIGTMGPMIASGPFETMAENGSVNWRDIFYGLSFAGAGISILIFFFVKNNHVKAGKFQILKRPKSVRKTLKEVCSNIQGWSIAIFSGLVYFALEYLSENEGKAFIMLKGYEGVFAAYMITLAWFTFAIACPLTGFLSDRFKLRKPFLILSAFSASLGIGLLIYSSNQILIIFGAMCLGFGASGQSIAFALMAEQYKKVYLAVALSLNNTFIMFLGAINAPVLGIFIDLSRQETIEPALSNYHIAFSLLFVCVALSIIFPIFFIKESYCKSNAEFTVLKYT